MSDQPLAAHFSWLRPLRAQLSKLKPPYFVAYSGGLDSTVLLHIAVDVLGPASIQAIHVNHGLSNQADSWQAHCQHVAVLLGCAFTACKVEVKNTGEGLEAAARSARYGVFAQQLQHGGVLLMGHHADDQIETVLLNLARGSGVAGLSGIPVQRNLANGQLYRPLLDIPRQALQEYAVLHDLPYIEDESNASLQFDRNYLRHKVIPRLSERFSHLHSAVTASTRAMAEAEELLSESAYRDMPIDQRQLAVDALAELSSARRHNVLRYWFGHHAEQHLSRTSLSVLDGFILSHRGDAINEHSQGDWVFYCQRGVLHITQNEPQADCEWSAHWRFDQPLQTPYGTLSAEPVDSGWVFPESVEVSFRRGGEKLKVMGRDCNKSLKTLFKELDIPAWQRTRIPLLVKEGELLALADIICAEQCRPKLGVGGWKIIWQPHKISVP